ncbi:MAG TPA: hypothetical protein VGC41_11975 [Kofleriaceae bacterium]
MIASIGAVHDVMDIDVVRSSAARHPTLSVVAPPDEAAHLRRDVLRRGTGLAHRTYALRIALGAIDLDRIDRDHLPRRILPSGSALLADRGHDLVARAAVVRFAAIEHGGAQRFDERIVLEESILLGGQHLARLPQPRERAAA